MRERERERVCCVRWKERRRWKTQTSSCPLSYQLLLHGRNWYLPSSPLFFSPQFFWNFFCCDCFYFPLKEIDVCKRVLSCLFSILSKFLFLSYGLGFIFDLGNLMKVTVFKVGFGIFMFSSLIRWEFNTQGIKLRFPMKMLCVENLNPRIGC